MLVHFGPQHWWPGETPFEIMVGAILTQNTNWGNVERAINNLKQQELLLPHKLFAVHPKTLASLIRPAGYYNIKTGRLRSFLQYFIEAYEGDVESMKQQPLGRLREELLAVKGVGPETADSILLYALDKPTFVIDAYTHRVMQRHNLSAEEASYHELQEQFMDNLDSDMGLFNEYHALLVAAGKHFCKTKKPLCEDCPLNGVNW